MVKLGFSFRTKLGARTNLIWGSAIVFALATIMALVWPMGVQAQDAYSSDLAYISITDQNGATIDVGAFDPAVTAYSASVGSTIERVTIRASASAQYWAKIYISPGDSQTASGHQVELNHGANLILVSGVPAYSQAGVEDL